MERELEKTLLEIECSIKDHERRGNTHTQSVLEQARDIVAMCAQAARTPSDLKEILDRETTAGWIPVWDRLPEYDDFVLVTVTGIYNALTFSSAIQLASYCKNDGWFIEGYPDWENPNVSAWRPLPEPYRPERSNDEKE